MPSKSNVLFFLLVLCSDQITKYWAVDGLTLGREVPVIDGIFNLTLVYNPGAAFGVFGGLPDFWRRLVLFGVSILALGVVFRFMVKDAKDDPISQIALSGILAGAIGNVIDRLRFDAVVDFLDFYWGNYHWPAFNIADSAISVGVFVLIVRMLFPGSSQQASTEAISASIDGEASQS
jgi:signal peptidase II